MKSVVGVRKCSSGRLSNCVRQQFHITVDRTNEQVHRSGWIDWCRKSHEENYVGSVLVGTSAFLQVPLYSVESETRHRRCQVSSRLKSIGDVTVLFSRHEGLLFHVCIGKQSNVVSVWWSVYSLPVKPELWSNSNVTTENYRISYPQPSTYVVSLPYWK